LRSTRCSSRSRLTTVLYDRLVGAHARVRALHCGGASRAETVANSLNELASHCADTDWVLVHDAARPCVPVEALARLVAEVADDPVGGLLAIPVADTLKREDRETPARYCAQKIARLVAGADAAAFPLRGAAARLRTRRRARRHR
jgi:2-C-methyl-D-erythritol 4-phosphate cytidylyltransferase